MKNNFEIFIVLMLLLASVVSALLGHITVNVYVVSGQGNSVGPEKHVAG